MEVGLAGLGGLPKQVLPGGASKTGPPGGGSRGGASGGSRGGSRGMPGGARKAVLTGLALSKLHRKSRLSVTLRARPPPDFAPPREFPPPEIPPRAPPAPRQTPAPQDAHVKTMVVIQDEGLPVRKTI